MCDLESEPWRANFTGPKCRCGVPTAGNEEEELIEENHRLLENAAKFTEYVRDSKSFQAWKNGPFAEERERRIAELIKKYRGN